MLQLPTTSPTRRFTKAEIADIARDAKPVSQRNRVAKDPTVKLVDAALRAFDRYVEYSQARDVLRAQHPAEIFATPAVFLPQSFMLLVSVSVNDHKFINADGIDRWVVQHRRHYEKQATKKRWDWKKACGGRVSPTKAKEYLAVIDKLEPALKKGLRLRQLEHSRKMRTIGYAQISAKADRAFVSYWGAMEKIIASKPKTVDGALAVLDFVIAHASVEHVTFQHGNGYGRMGPKPRMLLLRKARAALALNAEVKALRPGANL